MAKYCKNCGKRIDDDFCPYCYKNGVSQQESLTTQYLKLKKGEARIGQYTNLFLAIIFAIGSIIGALFYPFFWFGLIFSGMFLFGALLCHVFATDEDD